MSGWDESAYTKKQWFWAVNLTAILPVVGITLPGLFIAPLNALALSFYAFAVCFLIAWVLLAWPLSVGMRRPASWLKAGVWGIGLGACLAALGLLISTELHRRSGGQIGGGDFITIKDGIRTSYGWKLAIRNNLAFVGLCFVVALIVRAIIGPGKATP